jgi:molybdate transport system regulatory protein
MVGLRVIVRIGAILAPSRVAPSAHTTAFRQRCLDLAQAHAIVALDLRTALRDHTPLQQANPMAQLSIRIDFGPELRVGPGKIALLEQIAALGSISAGGRAMDMSYRRAWELIEELNTMFGQPVVESRSGGKKGGGATLTPLGLSLISRYRAMERAAAAAAEAHLKALELEIPQKA